MSVIMDVSRESLIDKLMWNGDLNQFWWIWQESNTDKTKSLYNIYDCKSVVVINGIVDDFTDEELLKLYHFSHTMTKDNDERYNDRIKTRKKIITKTPIADLKFMKPWMAKFEGSEYITPLDTLDEVLEYFNGR
ncbi:hypothetical protein SAMN04487895_101675 [Paenibacillus sophorae]|uniref:Uncharacterized protein n=1 Tax=Paenibacillus sophorae TaxID=1333845 RepID=A0A1H8GXK6_9BACL|nr:hypothetical protein [Paenibacillus sophorae]QWU14369.1 hypothetical protein KP014_20905 [Paenibacillus sophorae]SEN48550.1 hypothetical protein SAMN04487895_101675 [Paenibacillus sophorae]